MKTNSEWKAKGLPWKSQFNRSFAGPLDPSQILESEDDLQKYVTEGISGQYPYAGQIVSVVSNGLIKAYIVTAVGEQGDAVELAQVSSTPGGGNAGAAGGAFTFGGSISSSNWSSILKDTTNTLAAGTVYVASGDITIPSEDAANLFEGYTGSEAIVLHAGDVITCVKSNTLTVEEVEGSGNEGDEDYVAPVEGVPGVPGTFVIANSNIDDEKLNTLLKNALMGDITVVVKNNLIVNAKDDSGFTPAQKLFALATATKEAAVENPVANIHIVFEGSTTDTLLKFGTDSSLCATAMVEATYTPSYRFANTSNSVVTMGKFTISNDIQNETIKNGEKVYDVVVKIGVDRTPIEGKNGEYNYSTSIDTAYVLSENYIPTTTA